MQCDGLEHVTLRKGPSRGVDRHIRSLTCSPFFFFFWLEPLRSSLFASFGRRIPRCGPRSRVCASFSFRRVKGTPAEETVSLSVGRFQEEARPGRPVGGRARFRAVGQQAGRDPGAAHDHGEAVHREWGGPPGPEESPVTAQCGGGGCRPRRAMWAPAGRPSALTLSTGRWRHTPRFRGARLPPTSDGSTADRLAVNRRFPRALRTVGQCAGAARGTREARSRTSLRFISQTRRCVGGRPGDFGVRHSGGKWSGSLNPEPCPFGFMGLSLPRWGRLAPWPRECPQPASRGGGAGGRDGAGRESAPSPGAFHKPPRRGNQQLSPLRKFRGC